jgi:hypothetical protein
MSPLADSAHEFRCRGVHHASGTPRVASACGDRLADPVRHGLSHCPRGVIDPSPARQVRPSLTCSGPCDAHAFAVGRCFVHLAKESEAFLLRQPSVGLAQAGNGDQRRAWLVRTLAEANKPVEDDVNRMIREWNELNLFPASAARSVPARGIGAERRLP